MSAWLILPNGARIAVGPNGVRLGRAPDSDVVVSHPEASRRHGIVRPTNRGLEYAPLGRGMSRVNGKLIEGVTEVADGDRIEIPGFAAEILTLDEVSDETTIAWLLEGAGGTHHGLTTFPYTIGGNPADTLHVPGWPASAVRLQGSVEGLSAQLEGVLLNGQTMTPGEWAEVYPGDELSYGAVTYTVRQADRNDFGTTRISMTAGPADLATLEFLPRGGVLTMRLEGRAFTIQLYDLRCDLVAALLAPGEPHRAGDWIPDEVLATRIWGAAAGKGRTNINLVLHRVRHDLDRAGIRGKSLVERAPGGGATRFNLVPGSSVKVG